MKRFVLASCIVVVLLGGIVSYVQLGPIRTLLSIQKSFRIGDMELLDNSIDFEERREGLRCRAGRRKSNTRKHRSRNDGGFCEDFISKLLDHRSAY